MRQGVRTALDLVTSLGLPAVYLLYVYVVLVAPKSVTDGFWAFFFFDELPSWVRFSAALAPLLVPLVLATGVPGALGRWMAPMRSERLQSLFVWLAAVCALLIFWNFRERRYWGDGPTIVGLFNGSIGRGAIAEVFYWVHALDYLLGVALMKLTQAAWGWPAWEALALLSVLAGVGFVLLLAPTARSLASTRYGRAFVFCLPLTMGASQLWFGHIEHYPRVTVFMLATMLTAVRYLQKGRGAWAVFLVATVTLTAHPLSLCLAPGLCLLPFLGPHGVRGRFGFWVRALVPALVYLAGFFVVSRLLGAGDVVLNPWGMRFYVLPEEFTAIHVWNVLQNWLLTAPLGAALIGFDALRLKRAWRDPIFAILAVWTLSFVPFTLLFNHGMARLREWSLFAPAALPFALFVAYGHARYAEQAHSARVRGLAALVLSASFTIPWVASNYLHDKRPALQVAGNESDQENIRRGILTPTRNAMRP